MNDLLPFQMKNSSYDIKLHNGVERRDPNISIPGTWSKSTNQNIKESQSKFKYTSICVLFVNV